MFLANSHFNNVFVPKTKAPSYKTSIDLETFSNLSSSISAGGLKVSSFINILEAPVPVCFTL